MSRRNPASSDFLTGVLLGSVIALVFCLLVLGGVLVYFSHQAARLHMAADGIEDAIREAHKKSDLLAERRMTELYKALKLTPQEQPKTAGPAAAPIDAKGLDEFLSKALNQYGEMLGSNEEREDMNRLLGQLNVALGGAKKAKGERKNGPAPSEKP